MGVEDTHEQFEVELELILEGLGVGGDDGLLAEGEGTGEVGQGLTGTGGAFDEEGALAEE
ncbi:hypothetical protein [Frondihabitans sucicola]|uniref:hypothetical protein n=1 Tax=Frondihabitans sucicola TaxID=1268041 RepID=UPI00330683B9